jgi:hypothetical protein
MRNRESITYMMVSSTERVFALPELLEPILLYLLEELSPFSYQEDPRNSRVYNNANVLQHLLNCSQVCKQSNHPTFSTNPTSTLPTPRPQQ